MGRFSCRGSTTTSNPLLPKEQTATASLPDEGPSWKVTFGADTFVADVEGRRPQDQPAVQPDRKHCRNVVGVYRRRE